MVQTDELGLQISFQGSPAARGFVVFPRQGMQGTPFNRTLQWSGQPGAASTLVSAEHCNPGLATEPAHLQRPSGGIGAEVESRGASCLSPQEMQRRAQTYLIETIECEKENQSHLENLLTTDLSFLGVGLYSSCP